MQTSLSRLQTFYGHMKPLELLHAMITDEFKNDIALVSSFGAGSALLISLVAEVDNKTPILFLETRKHFDETLEYVETLRKRFNLKGLKLLTPDNKLEKQLDPDGTLWRTHPTKCCWFRKVEPLQRELKNTNYKALITGRKRYQTLERNNMDTIELHEDGRFRINPLALWDAERTKKEFKKRDLPEHPLYNKGFKSIGCLPCTRPVKKGEDERAGRWAHTAELPGGEQKTECGIHIASPDDPNYSPQKPDWNI